MPDSPIFTNRAISYRGYMRILFYTWVICCGEHRFKEQATDIYGQGTKKLIPWYDRCLGLCSNAVKEQFTLYNDISISDNP